MWYDTEAIGVLVGKTLTEVTKTEEYGDDVIRFVDTEGNEYKMYHQQDCCEGVSIDDINGDLQDLIGSPITLAEESVSTEKQAWETPKDENEYYDESFTWTFYRLATAKGYVNIRWYGSSNGYYSEGVSFVQTNKKENE